MKRGLFLLLLIQLPALLWGQRLTPKQVGELWGYTDEAGNLVIPAVFKYVTEFNCGVAGAVKDTGIGLIDTTGTFIVRDIFSSCPNRFGETAFLPNYKGQKQHISWVAHELTDASAATLGVVWVDQNGKYIITQAKRIYRLSDRIPDKLWDY